MPTTLLFTIVAMFAAAPQLDEKLGWSFVDGDDGLMVLAYRDENSDYVALAFHCQRKQDRVRLWKSGGVRRDFTLRSGRVRATYAGRDANDELLSIESRRQIRTAAPVLREFMRTGRIAMAQDNPDDSAIAPATGDDLKEVREFFDRCSGDYDRREAGDPVPARR